MNDQEVASDLRNLLFLFFHGMIIVPLFFAVIHEGTCHQKCTEGEALCLSAARVRSFGRDHLLSRRAPHDQLMWRW